VVYGGCEVDMKTVDVERLGGQVAQLVADVEQGEEIVISRSGKAVAKLVRVPEQRSAPRQLGTLKGSLSVPENFDDPLPDWLLDAFEGR